jgi:hypothetical protein
MPTVALFRSRRGGRALGAAVNAVLLMVGAPYLWCPVHHFPAALPFHGPQWYNPYAAITSAASWRKVNLHAHSRAWAGLTNGQGSADDVLKHYRTMGYDAAPVSNYQEISRASDADSTALTVYEQGFNVRKTHFLAVAPRSVDWLDYPLLQGRDEEQHRIDRLRAASGAVIMAHPRLRRALTDADLRALTGYTAIEIGSNEERSEDAWNVALDAGRPVWAVANDDTHHGSSPNETGRYWTMIATASVDASSIVAALQAGRVYAVFGHRGQADVAVSEMAVAGDTLSLALTGAPAELFLVGSSGRVLDRRFAASGGRWVLPCDAAWVRVVVRTARTRLYLQPLLHSENGAIPRLVATTAKGPTLVRRALAILLVLGVVASILTSRPRRTSAAVTDLDIVLREAA